MKIHFTTFKGGQEQFIFDSKILKKGEKLERFLLNTDDEGKIYIIPMIVQNKYCHYGGQILEKV